MSKKKKKVEGLESKYATRPTITNNNDKDKTKQKGKDKIYNKNSLASLALNVIGAAESVRICYVEKTQL